jgi:hypothetical protein
MPNDAKLGLVCGVALVIAVGVVFFRKDGPGLAPAADPAAIVKPTPAATEPTNQQSARPAPPPSAPPRRPEWD